MGMANMKIAVDIDGILTNETKGHDYSKRTPNSYNIQNVNFLYDNGYEIVLWSARFKQDRKITKEWLKKWEVKYHKLILGKLQYDYIFDDKYFQQVENYKWNLVENQCPRVKNNLIAPSENHPCFFCGHPINVKSGDCPTCGIMKCPKCGQCYCDIDINKKILLYNFHRNCCHNVDNPKIKVDKELASKLPTLVGAFDFCKNKMKKKQ